MTIKNDDVDVDFRMVVAFEQFIHSSNLQADLEYTGAKLIA